MKLSSVVVGILASILMLVPATAIGQTWTPLNNQPPVSVGAMLLLTDGRVLVHEEPNCSGTGCVGSDYTAWYTLTPDSTGSYINGTWTKVASLPTSYSPLFFSSAVLPDGKVAFKAANITVRPPAALMRGKALARCTIRWPTLGPPLALR